MGHTFGMNTGGLRAHCFFGQYPTHSVPTVPHEHIAFQLPDNRLVGGKCVMLRLTGWESRSEERAQLFPVRVQPIFCGVAIMTTMP